MLVYLRGILNIVYLYNETIKKSKFKKVKKIILVHELYEGVIDHEIIKSFKKIENLNFEFTQTINGKDETGNCLSLIHI